MNVLVKHGTTDITTYVISYDREINICTGIGTLDLVLSGTYSTPISPHDTFSIHENGDFKVKYYVSDVDRTAPEGTIRLRCQDKSKYLVDYFIADQYVIDYPSYTRYWIEKFFTEAGISYSFTTSSQGNLLSNYTSLGLQPAYDQIMMLCQLSGWYFYFDGNGVAKVGSLSTDISSAGNVNKTDILSIKKTTDDKMLRNRAVVWGQYDPLRREFAYADVSKNTPWNYDSRDKRSMVVSNNNIPNKSSAYSIANILLKEFARATVTKELTLHGARDYNLGEMLRVSSGIWSGRGLITSFGVSMSRSGLITKVILDERCPRLFGFFNFGDYVYVGTYGDGVWRKHIRFDPTWYNFSTGLTNLQITDIHINNGVFGSVGSNGEMYYALYELPWHEIQFSGLESFQEDTVISGVGTPAVFSGLNARAVIVDKLTNTVKYAVDTYSGLNTGDFFDTYSGFMTASGITISGNRSWIVEYDVLNGDVSGTPYPISISGNYNLLVLDIENDGRNDFVSVATMSGGGQIPSNEYGYNFGKHTSAPKRETWDSRSIVSYNLNTNLDLEGQSKSTSLGTFAVGYSTFENQTVGEREIVARVTDSGTRRYKRISVTKPYDPSIGRERVTFTTLLSPIVTAEPSEGFFLSIIKISNTVYRHYHSSTTGTTATELKYNIEYRDWDTVSNTVSAFSTAATLTLTKEAGKSYFTTFGFLTIEDNIYFYGSLIGRAALADPANITNYVEVYGLKFNTTSGTSIYNGLLHREDYRSAGGGGGLTDSWTIDRFVPKLTQVGQNVNWTMCVGEWNYPNFALASEFHNHLLYSHDGLNFTSIQIQETFSNSDPDFLYATQAGECNQLTGTHYIWWIRGGLTSDVVYVYNGSTVVITTYSDVPFNWKTANIHPIFGGLNNYYAAYDGATYYYCNAGTFALHSTMTFDARYNSMKPINTASSYAETYFWLANDSTLGQNVILKTTTTAVLNYIAPYGGFTWFDGDVTLIIGNFLVNTTLLVSATPKMLYLDNTDAQIEAMEFLVLRRDEYDFVVIEREIYPIRIDISNNSPLLTVGSGAGSFHSQYVFDTLLETVTPSPLADGINNGVNDYRYALLETISGAVTTSGFPVTTQILMATGSGIMTADAETYSGGFTLAYSIPSGIAGRIETTNFTYPGQYIFVTTSGANPAFYQKDNDKQYFDTYSGLPASRATIIRIDDYL